VSTEIVTFNFHGDEIEVISTPDGEHWAVLARLCAPFGIQPHPQAEKLKEAPWACTRIIRAHDASGRKQELFCLNIRSVAGWLFSLNAGKVAEPLREKLVRYQRDCADDLADRFLGPRRPVLPAPAQNTPPLLGSGRAVPPLAALDMDVIATLLREWSRLGDTGRGFTARELCQRLERPELQEQLAPLRWAFERMAGRVINPMRMANALRRYRWSTLDGMVLIGAKRSRGGTPRWKVTTMDQAAEEPWTV
jgi:hypothetical protein